MQRRKGFTLIELLVVIAIIGILAAMLFPVFARARESARKTQCLANVKNIAIAMNMYLTDYDKFWPHEHSDAVRNYLINDIEQGSGVCDTSCDSFMGCRGDALNPYLRIPVILDEYTKNRDIWKCPSAKITWGDITINPGINGSWLDYIATHDAAGDCPRPRACNNVFPPGWGGKATDTCLQAWDGGCGVAGQDGSFAQHYNVPGNLTELSTGALNDSAKHVVVGDGGSNLGSDRTSSFAYPDNCRIDHKACDVTCGSRYEDSDCGNPTVAEICAPLRVDKGGDTKWTFDSTFRKTHSRHLGGSNLGFADGHAKWMPSEKILFAGNRNPSTYADGTNDLEGLEVCFNPGTKVINP